MNFETLNAVPACDFESLLSDVFGTAPWIAKAIEDDRPFSSVRRLHQAMAQAVVDANRRDQQDLLCAQKPLANHRPFKEGVGSAMSDDERRTYDELAEEYERRFGYPFIMALEGHDKDEVLGELTRRLENDEDDERHEALRQLSEIARHRLEQLIETGG